MDMPCILFIDRFDFPSVVEKFICPVEGVGYMVSFDELPSVFKI